MPSGIYVRTPNTIEALRDAAKRARPHSVESRVRQAEAIRGKKLPPRSAEWCEKLRLGALKRAPKSADERERIGAFHRGKPLSYEHRAKLKSAAQRREGATTPELLKAADFMRNCVYRLQATSRPRRTFEILGYTREQLRAHLEAQFTDGMNWFNYGKKGWHIDHVYPIARFVKAGIIDPRIVNALANLRPLWALENHRKSSRMA